MRFSALILTFLFLFPNGAISGMTVGGLANAGMTSLRECLTKHGAQMRLAKGADNTLAGVVANADGKIVTAVQTSRTPMAALLQQKPSAVAAKMRRMSYAFNQSAVGKAAGRAGNVAKKAGAITLNSAYRFFPESAKFFVALGAIAYYNAMMHAESHPMAAQSLWDAQFDPVTHISFYAFILANAQVSSVIMPYAGANAMSRLMFPYLGMSVGMMASNIVHEVSAIPGFRECSAAKMSHMMNFGLPKAANHDDGNSKCDEFARNFWELDKTERAREWMPGLASLILSAGIAALGEKAVCTATSLATAGLHKIKWFDVVLLPLGGKVLQVSAVKVTTQFLKDTGKLGMFVYAGEILNEPFQYLYGKYMTTVPDIEASQEDINARLEEKKKTKFVEAEYIASKQRIRNIPSMLKACTATNKDNCRRDLDLEMRHYTDLNRKWRQTILGPIMIANGNWVRAISDLKSKYDFAQSVYTNFGETVAFKLRNPRNFTTMDLSYPLYGVLPLNPELYDLLAYLKTPGPIVTSQIKAANMVGETLYSVIVKNQKFPFKALIRRNFNIDREINKIFNSFVLSDMNSDEQQSLGLLRQTLLSGDGEQVRWSLDFISKSLSVFPVNEEAQTPYSLALNKILTSLQQAGTSKLSEAELQEVDQTILIQNIVDQIVRMLLADLPAPLTAEMEFDLRSMREQDLKRLLEVSKDLQSSDQMVIGRALDRLNKMAQPCFAASDRQSQEYMKLAAAVRYALGNPSPKWKAGEAYMDIQNQVIQFQLHDTPMNMYDFRYASCQKEKMENIDRAYLGMAMGPDLRNRESLISAKSAVNMGFAWDRTFSYPRIVIPELERTDHYASGRYNAVKSSIFDLRFQKQENTGAVKIENLFEILRDPKNIRADFIGTNGENNSDVWWKNGPLLHFLRAFMKYENVYMDLMKKFYWALVNGTDSSIPLLPSWIPGAQALPEIPTPAMDRPAILPLMRAETQQYLQILQEIPRLKDHPDIMRDLRGLSGMIDRSQRLFYYHMRLGSDDFNAVKDAADVSEVLVSLFPEDELVNIQKEAGALGEQILSMADNSRFHPYELTVIRAGLDGLNAILQDSLTYAQIVTLVSYKDNYGTDGKAKKKACMNVAGPQNPLNQLGPQAKQEYCPGQ